MDASLLHLLPLDTLHHIFSILPLRQIAICKSVCKFFNQTLSSPSFLTLISTRSPLHLITLCPPQSSRRRVFPDPFLHVFNLDHNQWLRLPLDFLPYSSPVPAASCFGLMYVWVDLPDSSKSLVFCNPLTRQFHDLPPLGSAWPRHGTVLVGSAGQVLILSELAALYISGSLCSWLKFPSNLPSKPWCPVLVADSVFALCDCGPPWQSQWKLFSCSLAELQKSQKWNELEKDEWGDVFNILEKPTLIQGSSNTILLVGGLKSPLFWLNAPCSSILILRLNLDTLELDEVGRMPDDMFTSFADLTKFKVFGGGDRVCFSMRNLRKLAMWSCISEEGKGEWRWIEDIPVNSDGLNGGFAFDAMLNPIP